MTQLPGVKPKAVTHSLPSFSPRRPLAFILLGFTILWAVYVWLIPPFEGPDGPQHWAYVVWLVEQGGFPPQGAEAWQTAVQQEAGQPPLYYLLAAIPAWLVGVDNPPATFQPNPYFPSSAPGIVPDNKMIGVYETSRPQTGGWLALTLARVVSLSGGWLTILFTYGLVVETWPKKPTLALAAATLVAVTPQLVFLSSVVSNDIFAAATGTLTLWFMARLIRRGLTPGRALFLGFAWGLACLSKSNALLLGAPLALAGVWLALSPSDKSTRFSRLGRYLFYLALGFTLIAGWWYVRAWVLTGSPFGTEVHCQAPWAHCALPEARQKPLAEWREVFDSYWVALGWGNIKFPGPVYTALGLMVIAAAIGVCQRARQRWQRQDFSLLPAHIILLLCLVALLTEMVALELWMRQVTAPHGRLLFPALGAVALWLITGWDALHPKLAQGAWGPIAALSIFVPWMLLYPAYFPSRPQSREQVLAEGRLVGWRYGGLVELLTVRPQSRSVDAGDVLTLHACWQTLATTNKQHAVFVQLIGPANQVVAQRRSYPDLGRYPTTHWTVGQVYCEELRMDIPTDLAQTLVYEIHLSWLDEAGQRLPIETGQGEEVAAAFVGQVRLVAEGTKWGNAAADQPPFSLINNTLPPQWHISQTQPLTLTWQIAQPVPTNYTVFIHFRDPQTGQNSFTADGPPLAGWYPTSWWTMAEIITDRHNITIPATVTPGEYNLVIGWYDPPTGSTPIPEIPLGSITIQP